MSAQSLGPNSFPSDHPHEPHPAWLHSFKPRERHDLIEEDITARNTAFAVLAGSMLFGMTIALIVLFTVIWPS